MTTECAITGRPRILRGLLVITLCLMLQGCLITLFKMHSAVINIEENSSILRPRALGVDVELRGFSVFVDDRGNQTRMESLMIVRDDFMHLTLLSPVGGRLGSLQQQGQVAGWYPPPANEKEREEWEDAYVQPWHLVLMTQLAIWPESAVRSMLEGTRWKMRTSETLRTYYYKDFQVLEIEVQSNERPWIGPIVIHQRGFGIEGRVLIVPLGGFSADEPTSDLG